MKFSERRLLVSLLPPLMLLALAAEGARGQCPGDGFWDSLAPMPDARKGTSSAVVDGKIYVFGDHRLNAFWDRTEAYDPQSDEWTQLAPIPTGRGMAAAAVVDGIIYLIGGNNSYDNYWLTTNEAYDPATDSWTTKADMPTTDRGLLTASAVDGLIYVMGGGDSFDQSSPYRIVEIYDPATDSWTDGVDMLRSRQSHAAVVIGKEIYLIGGLTRDQSNQIVHVPEIDVFNTVTQEWRQVAPLPTVRFDLTAVVLGGRIYAMGGNVYQTPIVYSIVEEYDPRLDCWTGVTPLPSPLTQQCAAVVGNTIYSIGGTNDPRGQDALADNLGGAPRPVVGDMNGDGVVNAFDIEGFLDRLFP